MLQLLAAIGLVTLSIFVHELGHFLAARWRRLAVVRFSIIGLGNPIATWRWRGVEYCICWLPIGAYVMIPQLADLGALEGDLPPEQANLPPASFTSKTLVAIAGPAANLGLALVLACVVWQVGYLVPAEYNRTEIGDISREMVDSDGRTVPGPAAAADLRLGDVVQAIDGKAVSTFQDLVTGVLFGSQSDPDGRRYAILTIDRDGHVLTKKVYPVLVGIDRIRSIGVGPRSDLIVERVTPGSPAAEAGLLPGDQITAVDGSQLARREELREYFQKRAGAPSVLTLKRGPQTITATVRARPQKIQGQEIYLIGVLWKIETVLVRKNPLEQFADAYSQVFAALSSIVNVRSDIGVRHMSGIVGIVDNLQQAASAGVIPTLTFLILINISLATFNLLPLPVLDGGHVVIAAITKLRGRPINPQILFGTVKVCFLMLIGLIVYVSYNDIRRLVLGLAEEKAPAAAPAKPGK